MYDIDIERLRNDLMNYFGAAASFNKAALVDLFQVESCDEEKLIEIAKKNKFDLKKYIKEYKTYYK